MDELTEIAFQIILHAGNGRSSAMEAIQEAKEGNFEKADNLMKEAGEELAIAHGYHSRLLQKEASGKSAPVNVILIHAQDHLMTAITVKDLALEFVELYKNK